MVPGGNPRRVLEAVRRDYPVVLHGVSLSIGSIDPLRRTLPRRAGGARARRRAGLDLRSPVLGHRRTASTRTICCRWRTPKSRWRTSSVACRRCRSASGAASCSRTRRPTCSFAGAEMTEWEFLAELARRADCGILLDVNNVFVSAHNHGFDPRAYLRALPAERIGQIHLAGHSVEGELLIDTHDGYVRAEVWQLYAETDRRFGARATMIEWDAQVPAFEELERRARSRGRMGPGGTGSAAGGPPCRLKLGRRVVRRWPRCGAVLALITRPGGRKSWRGGRRADHRRRARERRRAAPRLPAHVPRADRRGARGAVPAPRAGWGRCVRRAGVGVHHRRAVAPSLAALRRPAPARLAEWVAGAGFAGAGRLGPPRMGACRCLRPGRRRDADARGPSRVAHGALRRAPASLGDGTPTGHGSGRHGRAMGRARRGSRQRRPTTRHPASAPSRSSSGETTPSSITASSTKPSAPRWSWPPRAPASA